MISMTAKATVIVVTMMFSVIFAYGSVATELSKNEATQDQPMIITKHHGWQELAPKDIGASFQKKNAHPRRSSFQMKRKMHLRNEDLPAVPLVQWTELAQSTAVARANLVSIIQKTHAAQVLEEMTTSSTCTDGEMFNIVAPIAPIFEGCFQDIGIDLFGEAVYIQTEGSGPGEAIMFPFKSDETSSVLTEPMDFWMLGHYPPEGEVDFFCLSFESASESHPADISTWFCNLEDPNALEEVGEDEFSIGCGCL